MSAPKPSRPVLIQGTQRSLGSHWQRPELVVRMLPPFFPGKDSLGPSLVLSRCRDISLDPSAENCFACRTSAGSASNNGSYSSRGQRSKVGLQNVARTSGGLNPKSKGPEKFEATWVCLGLPITAFPLFDPFSPTSCIPKPITTRTQDSHMPPTHFSSF